MCHFHNCCFQPIWSRFYKAWSLALVPATTAADYHIRISIERPLSARSWNIQPSRLCRQYDLSVDPDNSICNMRHPMWQKVSEKPLWDLMCCKTDHLCVHKSKVKVYQGSWSSSSIPFSTSVLIVSLIKGVWVCFWAAQYYWLSALSAASKAFFKISWLMLIGHSSNSISSMLGEEPIMTSKQCAIPSEYCARRSFSLVDTSNSYSYGRYILLGALISSGKGSQGLVRY